MISKKGLKVLSFLAVLSLLFGCGDSTYGEDKKPDSIPAGSGSGSGSGKKISNLQGTAIKGIISGGTVKCYDANDAILSIATTDVNGKYTLADCTNGTRIEVSGGTDKSTGQTVEKLEAPIDSKYITPVTHLRQLIKKGKVSSSKLDPTTKALIENSKDTNPLDNTSANSKKLAKLAVVLDVLVKNVADSDTSGTKAKNYEKAFEVVADAVTDTVATNLKSITDGTSVISSTAIGNVIKKIKEKTKITIPDAKITSIKKIGETTAIKIQELDKNVKGLVTGESGKSALIPKNIIPQGKRSDFTIQEVKSGTDFKVNFKISGALETALNKDPKNIEFKCKVFPTTVNSMAITSIIFDNAGKNAGITTPCNKDFTMPFSSDDKGKVFAVKITQNKIDRYYALKIGSIAGISELKAENKVFLPVTSGAKSWVIKDTSDVNKGVIKDLYTNSDSMAYLPVGYFYKMSQITTDSRSDVYFGLQFKIAKKSGGYERIDLYVNNLTFTGNITNPTTYLSTMKLKTHDGEWRKAVDISLNTPFRFKKPKGKWLNDTFPATKSSSPDLTSGEKVLGIDFSTLCNVSVADAVNTSSTAIKYSTNTKICRYIKSRMTENESPSVSVTPFIGGAMLKTALPSKVVLQGIVPDMYDFPTVKFYGNLTKKTSIINVAGNSSTLTDTDGDGVSDEWELRLGRDPFKADSLTKDSDFNGVSDIEQIKSGNVTKPTKPTTPTTVKVPDITKIKFIRGTGADARKITIGYDTTDSDGILAMLVKRTNPSDTAYANVWGHWKLLVEGSDKKTYTESIPESAMEQYSLIIKRFSGKKVSNIVELAPDKRLTFGALPKTATPTIAGTYNPDEILTASVTPKSGYTIEYKWQKANQFNVPVYDSEWSDITGKTSPTFKVPTTGYTTDDSPNPTYIRVIVRYKSTTNANAVFAWTASTNPQKVTKDSTIPTIPAPIITGTHNPGQILEVTNIPAVNGYTIKYQWQKVKSSTPATMSSAWADIRNANSAGFTIPATGYVTTPPTYIAVTAYYVKDSNPNVTSPTMFPANPQKVVAIPVAVIPTMSAPTITGTYNPNQTLTTGAITAVSGYEIEYKWQKVSSANAPDSGSVWLDISGKTSSTFTIPATGYVTTPSTYIRVMARYKNTTNASTVSAWTASANPQKVVATSVAVIPTMSAPTITGTYNPNQTLTTGAITAVNGYAIEYQWQKVESIQQPTSGSVWADIPTANTATFAIPATGYVGINPTYIRVKARYKNTANANTVSAWTASANPQKVVAVPTGFGIVTLKMGIGADNLVADTPYNPVSHSSTVTGTGMTALHAFVTVRNLPNIPTTNMPDLGDGGVIILKNSTDGTTLRLNLAPFNADHSAGSFGGTVHCMDGSGRGKLCTTYRFASPMPSIHPSVKGKTWEIKKIVLGSKSSTASRLETITIN